MSRQDGQLLMDTAAGLISKVVGERGGFLPFAVALTSAGPLTIVHVDYTEDGGDPIDQLRSVLRREVATNSYLSVAVAADIEIVEPQTGQRTRAARVEI